jgi:hypothetical protein
MVLAGSAAGEFALDGGEDAFDQGVVHRFGVEVFPHLGAGSRGTATDEMGGGNDTVSLRQLAPEHTIAFGIELGVGQACSRRVECPALFVPVEMRQTGARGAIWPEGRSTQQSRW